VQRAKSMIAVGDIASRRLLLEARQVAPDANAGADAGGHTMPKDGNVGTSANIVAEPAKARCWYQRPPSSG